MNYAYAGIGSRKVPKEIFIYFIRLGSYLARKNFILRSGHAEGSDQAFEQGCDKSKGHKEIFIPWKNFEDSNSTFIVNNPKAFEIAKKFHPTWNALSQGAQKLQARNSHQVLGWDLNNYSKFIICWTRNGEGGGGTGQAIRIANAYNIPIFDAGTYNNLDTIKSELKSFLLKNNFLKEDDFIQK